MEIQTYEIEEAVGGTTPEIEAEAVQLIDDLKLEGQRSLVYREPETATEQRVQYPLMTVEERVVYSALFPIRTDVEKYDCGIIPVRVLQVIAHAREQFKSLEVWHKQVRDPDPILVGVIDRKQYLLARWGDALQQFGELAKEARRIIKDQIKRKIEERIREAQSALADLDGQVHYHFERGWSAYA